MDINGDGLSDKVYNDGTIRLNLGYSFAGPEKWNFDAIREGKSIDFGGGLGVNIKNNSISAGVGISKTLSEAKISFMDVNSDGLPDLVKDKTVMFNTGEGFAPAVNWDGMGALDAGKSIGESANAGFTVAIGIPIIQVKVCVNPSGSVSRGVSYSTTQLSDFDGDGMPDFLSSEKEGELYIKPSTINRTNMLKMVHRPMGSNFALDYMQTPATYKHPGGKWALASVKSFDGLKGDGVDSSLVTFEYTNGSYNRRERAFYGFDTVRTHFHNTANSNKIYRSQIQHFDNSSYYTRGMLLSDLLVDGNGRKQTGSENKYSFRNIYTSAKIDASFAQNDTMPMFVTLDETRQHVFEGADKPLISTRVEFVYDKMGNVVNYTDFANEIASNRVDVNIGYHFNAEKYIYSVPSYQEVITAEGLMRKRETMVNNSGDITSISQMIDDSNKAVFEMEYDTYGNLTKIIRPRNYKGERMWYAYEYDDTIHSLVTKITDAFGYSSSTKYDYLLGAPLETSDKNSQLMRYSYDACGRVKTITGPYEIASGKPYTIAFNYHPEAEVPYAQTLHYDNIHDSNIETYTFTDGIGRPVQVKKNSLLFIGEGSEDTNGYIVSGKVMYDAFGRAVNAYQPIFEPTGSAVLYNSNPDKIKPTYTEYDVLDRALKVTLPDGATTKHSYGIAPFNGENMHADTITDAMGRVALTFTDVKGRQVSSIIKSNEGDITTRFEYNTLGEILAVTDPKGNKTLSVYDLAGRRISVNQPDGGFTEFQYDNAGNILKKITANLRKTIPNGGAITYKYDYERLTEIVYPRNIQNRVQYSYGAPGALFGRAGRVSLVQDASGGQEYFYGPLGEAVKTIRTIQLSESDMRTWVWSATYDTWNRVQQMVYPDNEIVTYTYNKAGNLQNVTGEKLGRAYKYVDQIGYDKYEKQVYLRYGNGSVTTYNYEPERQRLAQMDITTKGKKFMNNVYSYDVLNNILGITNNATPEGNIGGTSWHTYSYDDINRLVQATGAYTGAKDTVTYNLLMKYDIMGNILQKKQTHIKNNETPTATNYDLSYKYEGPKPNAASQIGERNFNYDENGNLTFWEDTITNSYRQLAWDEENRLMYLSDNGYISNYVYDAGGERVIKSHGGSQGVYINGAPAGIINHIDANFTVYVSPYFVVQNERFTKHYYAGSSRVSTKIGNGKFENQYRSGVFEITAGGVNYINRQQQMVNNRKEYIRKLGIPPGPPTMKGVGADPYLTGTAIPDDGAPNGEIPRGWPRKPIFAPAGGPPGAPMQWGDEVTNNTVTPGFGYLGTGGDPEILQYFYHSDHLGSASYITNINGDITQFIAYMPFGETLAEQHADWDSPFKFNGKEMDSETGLYYYGARYYDAKTSVWLGVDPMAEKYPTIGAYVYCMGNSLRYIDPKGLDNYDINENGTITVQRTKDNSNTYSYIKEDGTRTDLGTFNKNKKGLIFLPSKGISFTNNSNESKSYIDGDMAAGFLGASMKFFEETGIKTQINQLTTGDGGHSGHSLKKPGTNADIRYINTKGNVNESLWTNSKFFDKEKSQDMVNILKSFGFDKSNSMLTENPKGNGAALKGTYFVDGKGKFHHQHHIHLQQFNFDHIEMANPLKYEPIKMAPYYYFPADNTRVVLRLINKY